MCLPTAHRRVVRKIVKDVIQRGPCGDERVFEQIGSDDGFSKTLPSSLPVTIQIWKPFLAGSAALSSRDGNSNEDCRHNNTWPHPSWLLGAKQSGMKIHFGPHTAEDALFHPDAAMTGVIWTCASPGTGEPRAGAVAKCLERRPT